jgi:spermidine synthase
MGAMKNTVAISCFFLSGFAGLVYEVAWIRRASLVFGSTTWALSTVLAVFFGGLALGSWLFGRWGQRVRRPIRMYARLEIGLALLALLSLRAFDLVDGLYGAAYRSAVHVSVDDAGLHWLTAGGQLTLVRVALVALVLLPPTFLMGGTLPLFCRQFVRDEGRVIRNLGSLYGVNTLGAVLGTLAAGFLLIPLAGVSGAVSLAAGINILIAIIAYLLRFDPLTVLPKSAHSAVEKQALVKTAAARFVVPTLFFTTGLVVVGAEIFWSRFLSLVIRDSVTTYTITLAVVLTGIVLGSLLVGLLEKVGRLKRVSLPLLFGIFQLTAALAVVWLMFLPARIWLDMGHGVAPFFLLMLPATILSGASFPLANRLVLHDPTFSASSVGRMTAINTLGGIVGSLVVGFFLLPGLGLAAGVKIITGVGLVTGVAALLLLEPVSGKARNLRLGLAAGCVVLWLGIPLLTGTSLPASFLGRSGHLLDYAEGHSSTLSAVNVEGVVNLEIDNLWQGIDKKGHQIMAAHLPALLHPNPESVLVIGVGVGQTAGRFLYHDITSLDCVDIEPAIFPFIDRHFPNDWLRDERVNLVADDGRTFTDHTDRSYDIISVEVGQIYRPGIDVFYTREFYADARDRLRPGGLVAQFVPLGFLQEASFQSVVATFLETFPAAGLWYNMQELLLIGGVEEAPRLDLARLRELETAAKITSPDGATNRVARDLAWNHWGGPRYHLIHPGAMLGSYLADAEGLETMAVGAPVYVDDIPRLAYETSDAELMDHHEEPMARYLSQHLAPFAGAVAGTVQPSELKLAEETRRLNLRDIVASGLIAQVIQSQDNTPAQINLGLLNQALKLNPESFLAHANTGKLLLMGGKAQQAEPFLVKAVELRSEAVDALRDLGMMYIVTERPAQALPYLKKALRLDPEEFGVRNYLGSALAMTGNPAAAIVHFEKALELQPGDTAVQQNLARARRGVEGR